MKNKIFLVILPLLVLFNFATIGDVNAAEGEVCKQETHWYYFSLADHSAKEKIEANAIDTKYSTTFSSSNWPENAKIESVTTYPGFSKEDIAMWFDLYVGMKVPTYTDGNGEVHHVHDFRYNNLNNNTSRTDNVDDSTRLNYDAIRNQGESVTNQFRNNYIENVYNGQIVPTSADVTITGIENDVVSAEISRTYGGTSLASVVAYNYVIDPADQNKTNNVYLITAKTKVVLNYDCEVPEEPTPEPEPEEPTPEEPTPEEPTPEEPLAEEPNPNTGDLGMILSSLMVMGASGTGFYAYRQRKKLL